MFAMNAADVCPDSFSCIRAQSIFHHPQVWQIFKQMQCNLLYPSSRKAESPHRHREGVACGDPQEVA